MSAELTATDNPSGITGGPGELRMR